MRDLNETLVGIVERLKGMNKKTLKVPLEASRGVAASYTYNSTYPKKHNIGNSCVIFNVQEQGLSNTKYRVKNQTKKKTNCVL